MKKTIVPLLYLFLFVNAVDAYSQVGNKIKLKGQVKDKIKILDGKNPSKGNTNSSKPLETNIPNTPTKPANQVFEIIFSDKPFSGTQSQSTKTVFTPQDNIYGRLILDRPLKKFKSETEGDDLVTLTFFIADTASYTNYDVTNNCIKQPLQETELNSNYVDFEIWVNKKFKKEATVKEFNFPANMHKIALQLYRNNDSHKKIVFRVKLDGEGSPALNGTGLGARFNPRIQSYGEFTLDFTGVTKENLSKMMYRVKSPVYDSDYIPNYKNKAIVTNTFIKTLPLADEFNLEKGVGYRDPKMTEEEIKKMVLNQFNTNEIVYFQFLKPEINSDYSEERAEGEGYSGMEKRGNKHFLMVFKDQDDGFYRAVRCTVIKYLEYGSETLETYLRTIQFKGDTQSTLTDYELRDIHHPGYVYLVDPDKIPKQ